jgi:hypothetical protein
MLQISEPLLKNSRITTMNSNVSGSIVITSKGGHFVVQAVQHGSSQPRSSANSLYGTPVSASHQPLSCLHWAASQIFESFDFSRLHYLSLAHCHSSITRITPQLPKHFTIRIAQMELQPNLSWVPQLLSASGNSYSATNAARVQVSPKRIWDLSCSLNLPTVNHITSPRHTNTKRYGETGGALIAKP